MPVNEYGQMIGESMEGYTPGALPSIDFLEGRYARIEALSVEKHAEDLLAVYGPDTPREMWTYLFQEPWKIFRGGFCFASSVTIMLRNKNVTSKS